MFRLLKQKQKQCVNRKVRNNRILPAKTICSYIQLIRPLIPWNLVHSEFDQINPIWLVLTVSISRSIIFGALEFTLEHKVLLNFV